MNKTNGAMLRAWQKHHPGSLPSENFEQGFVAGVAEALASQKESEPRFVAGDKIRYNGFTYEIEALVGKNRYAIKGLNFDLDEDMIDPYNETTEPKSDEMAASDIIREPEEEVRIEGWVERGTDGLPRLYTGYINSLILPRECNIEGEVTITIKPKKK